MGNEELIEISSKQLKWLSLIIGTSPHADIQIPQVGTVSPRHARISRKLFDAPTLTPISGDPLRIERDGRSFQLFDAQPLRDGDVIRCGGHVRLRWTETRA